MNGEILKGVRETVDFAAAAIKTKKSKLALKYLSMIPEEYKKNNLFKNDIEYIEWYAKQAGI